MARVKILDMGLTRLTQPLGDQTLENLTQRGAMMGTPDYMAPEQARDARSVDIRADIYSLGCTFVCLLTGKPPFPGGSLMEKMHRHIQAPPPRVGDIPDALNAQLARMLAKNVEDRPQTPAEIAEALTPFCAK